MGRLVKHISPSNLALMAANKLKAANHVRREMTKSREDPNVDIKLSHSSIIVNQSERFEQNMGEKGKNEKRLRSVIITHDPYLMSIVDRALKKK